MTATGVVGTHAPSSTSRHDAQGGVKHTMPSTSKPSTSSTSNNAPPVPPPAMTMKLGCNITIYERMRWIRKPRPSSNTKKGRQLFEGGGGASGDAKNGNGGGGGDVDGDGDVEWFPGILYNDFHELILDIQGNRRLQALCTLRKHKSPPTHQSVALLFYNRTLVIRTLPTGTLQNPNLHTDYVLDYFHHEARLYGYRTSKAGNGNGNGKGVEALENGVKAVLRLLKDSMDMGDEDEDMDMDMDDDMNMGEEEMFGTPQEQAYVIPPESEGKNKKDTNPNPNPNRAAQVSKKTKTTSNSKSKSKPKARPQAAPVRTSTRINPTSVASSVASSHKSTHTTQQKTQVQQQQQSQSKLTQKQLQFAAAPTAPAPAPMEKIDIGINPHDTWKNVYNAMRTIGWKYTNGDLQHAWWYMMPGKRKKQKEGVSHGVDYLVSEEELQQYAKEYYGWEGERAVESSSSSSSRSEESSESEESHFSDAEDEIVDDISVSNTNGGDVSSLESPVLQQKQKQNGVGSLVMNLEKVPTPNDVFDFNDNDDEESNESQESSTASSTSASTSTSTSTSIKSYEAWTSVWSKLESLGWTEVHANKRKKAVYQFDFYYLPPNETKKHGIHGVNYFYEEAMRDYVRVEYGWKGEKETKATKVKVSVKPPVKSVEMKNTSKKGKSKGKGKKSEDKKVTPKKSSSSSKKAKHSKKDMAKAKKEKKAASSKSNKKVKEKESKSKKRKNNDDSGSKSKKMAISPSVQSSISTLSSQSPTSSISSSASSLLSPSQITWKILKQEANWSYCTALNLFDSFSYLRPGITGKYCRSKDSDVVEGVHWFRTQEDAVAYAIAHPEFLPVGMRVNAEAEPAEAAEVESPSPSPSVASPSSANSGDTFIPLSIADHPNPWWIDDKLPKFNWQRLRACFPSNDKPNGGGFQYRSSGYITPDGNKYESVEAMARGVCRHGLPRAEMEALSPVDREYIERYFSMAYLPIKIGKRSIRSGSNSVQILSELLEHELGMGRSFTSDMAWDTLCAHFECHQTGEGQYHAPIVHVPLEMGMETDDDNDNDYGDKKEAMHMFDSLHDVREAIRSYGLNFLSGQDELLDQYYAAIILWSTALPLPLYETKTNTESESIANTSTDSKVDESQSKEEEEEQLESQTKKQDASVVEPKETETVIVLDDDKEEEDKKKDDILPDYSESEDDGNNDNDDDDDTSKAQIALSSKDVDASVVVANDDNDDDGADVPIEDIQSNVSKPSVDIAYEEADIMCNDDVEKDADSSTMKSAQEVGIDADATTTTTTAVTTPAEQEHINPNSNAHDDKHNDDLDMNMNDPNSKDLQVKHMPSLFEAEMEEDTEESTPVDVETTKAIASQVAADVNKVAKETEIVDPTIDADSQMVLVDDSERSLQMENGLNSQDVESKSKEGTDDVDTQMVLVASEACTETSTGTLVEIQKVSTLQVDVVERSSLEETNVEEQLTTMKAGVPRQAQSVGVSVLESPILEDPAPQDSISYQQPYRCSLRSLPPPENEKDMNIKISEILATVIAVPPKATQGMNVASMKPYQFSQKVAEEEEHDANALPRQEDSLVRKHSEEESCEFHDCKEIQSEEVEHEAENTNMEISKDHDQELMTQGQGCIEAAVNASPTLNWVESEGLDREDNDSSCFMTQDRNPTQDPNFDYEYNHGTLYPW